MQRARFGPRLGAAIIDALVLLVITAPFLMLLATNVVAGLFFSLLIPCTGGESTPDAELAMGRAIAVLLLTYGILLAYTLMDVALSATPGKLLLGLRIGDLHGAQPPLANRAARWAVKHSWLLVYGVALVLIAASQSLLPMGHILLWAARFTLVAVFISFLLAARPDRLAWHDVLTGTAVRQRLPDNSVSSEHAAG